jgi:NAD(P)-dependent dehydrogenase (short-subunit alcohol dehydrogenase family)
MSKVIITGAGRGLGTGIAREALAAGPAVKTEITAVRGNPVPVLIEIARDTRLLVVRTHRHYSPLPVGTTATGVGECASRPSAT